jgi:hypothetical protein
LEPVAVDDAFVGNAFVDANGNVTGLGGKK